ncbi:MAG: carboxylesterase family protein [Flavobacteriales bacterium]|jgi:dienelactone hydrolase|nr:carboxylesterase family protein [Flavobacteriales bacterium]
MPAIRSLPALLVALPLATALPTGQAGAQDCTIPFGLPLFAVHAEMDIPYGTATRYNGGTAQLALDLFKPVGDGQTERPLVVLVHGGGFTGGSRADLHDLGNSLASMGWAAATVSYRLGFYGTGILEPPYAYDPAEVRRAIYRSMQDVKGAVRFLKGRSGQDSTSTTSVFLVGFSAGAIASLTAGYMDLPAEKPASCGAIGDVQHFFNFHPRPDLGDVDGDIAQNGHDATVMGVAGIFGAMGDTAWFNGTVDPALYTYHQTGDPIVGCGLQRPYWGIGLGVPDNYPYLHGSCSIDAHVQQIGHAPGRYAFHQHPGDAHDVHDPVAVMLEAALWMRDLFCAMPTDVAEGTGPVPVLRPNPVRGRLFVDHIGDGPMPWRITDAQGREVRAGVHHQGGIDVEGLAPGTYHLHRAAGTRVGRFVVAQ